MLAALCVYVNQGVIYALGVYAARYVWLFTPADFVIQVGTFVVSATVAFLLAPRLGRRMGKPVLAARAVLAEGLPGETLHGRVAAAGVPRTYRLPAAA